ncbi:MAG: hypothetical protein HKP44_08890, partial [Desulfofustis sp.]|nr:hypothetical protein [Desulfofustis sp.]
MKIITNNATAKEKIGHVGDEHIETLRAFDDNDGWNGVGTIPATNVDGTDTWTLNAANNSSVRRDVLYATNQNDEFQVTLRIRATSGTPTVRLAFIHEGNWNDVMFETIQLSTSFQTFEATGIADLTANYSFRIRNDSTTVKTIQLQFFSIRRISPRTFTTTEYD